MVDQGTGDITRCGRFSQLPKRDNAVRAPRMVLHAIAGARKHVGTLAVRIVL
jgi:hypothetical protein